MVGQTTVYRNSSGKSSTSAARRVSPAAAQNAPSAARVYPNGKPAAIAPVKEAKSTAAYGAAFQLGPEKVVVEVPGGSAAVLLSESASAACGVVHDKNSPDLQVQVDGDYYIEYSLSLTVSTAKQAVFALQSEGSNIPGGVWDIPLKSGYQTITGFVIAHLEANSRIRIAMTAAEPLEVILTGSGTTATLGIRKL